MQIALFKALKSINISDDQASDVVKAFEEYLSMKIKEANAELVAQQKATNWLIGSIGTIIIISTLVTGLAPVIWKLFH